MSTTERLEPEALVIGLRRALRHGLRASRLARFAPDLVEMLVPLGRYPDVAPVDRAFRAENLIRASIERIGGDEARALLIVTGLAAGMHGRILEQRRQAAAEMIGVLPGTFRRANHEGLMLWDLAVELCAREIGHG